MADLRDDIIGFFRLGIELGLIDPSVAIAWADAEIMKMELPDEPLIDLALAAGKFRDQIIDALRHAGSRCDYSERSLRMVGALLSQRVDGGQLTTAEAANLLYRIGQIAKNAATVFGSNVFAVDEFFEEWMLGPDAAIREVRKMLLQFANEPFP